MICEKPCRYWFLQKKKIDVQIYFNMNWKVSFSKKQDILSWNLLRSWKWQNKNFQRLLIHCLIELGLNCEWFPEKSDCVCIIN